MKKVLPTNAVLVPDTASRVFKGVIFDVHQWSQEMFDGSTQTFEMLRRPDTVEVIVVRDGQVLLVHDEQPGRSVKIQLPGGRVDEDDASWLDAAKRELSEETGLECADWRLVFVKQPQSKIEWFIAIFVAQNIVNEGEQHLESEGEKITPEWRDFDVVRDAVLSGEDQIMHYLIPFFNEAKTVDDLLALPEYKGQDIDR